MANNILIKRNSTASVAPTAEQLTAGELAINTADGCLFTKNSAGTVVNLPVSSISGQAITPGQVNVDNIQLNDNTLSTTDIDGSLIVSPDGAGKILLGRTTADGTTNVVQCHSLTVRGSDTLGGGTTPSFTSTGATYFGNASGEVGLLCAIVPAETFDATHPTVYCFTGCNEPVTEYKPILFTAGYFAQFWLDPSGYVGIGTASPSATLDVAGSINVSSTLQLSGSTSGFVAFQSPDEPTSHTYTLPSVTGTAGQVLTTDGSSVLSWTTVSGVTGVTGATGVQGTAGTQGATGIQGSAGTQGATGIQGVVGVTGATGVQGTAGTQGATGVVGATGATGVQGATGVAGQGFSDGDKGDITIGSSGTTLTIDSSAVTYAKIQNVSATNVLLGRESAGAGVIQEIACTAAGRTLIASADAAVQRTNLGLGTIATQAATAVVVTGGTINGTTIGATTTSTGRFSTIVATASLSAGVTTPNAGNAPVYANGGALTNYPIVAAAGGTSSGIAFTNTGGQASVLSSNNDLLFLSNNVEKARVTAAGALQLSGSTSGFVAFQSPAAPTSHTYTLPAVTGTSGQVLTTNGSGTLSWTAPTIRATITATASQTSFTVSGGYTVGGIDVYLNGIKQVNGDDFTATNGTSITLTQGADAGDILDYVAFGFAVTTGALVKSGDTMTGSLTMTAGTTFTMSGFTETTVVIGNSSTAQTIAITTGTQVTCTLTGNCTFTMPTATAGKSFTLLLKTGAGAFTATFTGVKWPGATPTITATASRMDIISFLADGVNWYGRITQNYTP